MNDNITEHTRILSIDPTSKGFGFAVLEGHGRLVDWGVKEVRDNNNERCFKKIMELIDLYQPDGIVVEDYSGKGSRRCRRVQRLIKDFTSLALELNIKIYRYSRATVREAFSQSDAYTKHEIAATIANKFPELSVRLPPERKCYMPEDYRMAIFDAMSFAVAFYYFKDKKAGDDKQNNNDEYFNDTL